MSTRHSKLDQAVQTIRERWSSNAAAGIILGTGLGNLGTQIENSINIAANDLAGMPATTALGHHGTVICGNLAGCPIIAFQGRAHLYEGYSLSELTQNIRLAHRLGARMLIVSNASGGLNPRYSTGDIVTISDHINLLGRRCKFSSQTPYTRPLYDPQLIEQSCDAASELGLPRHRGVYAAMSGPNYETRAEYRFLRRIGADMVGMSTVPETITAARLGMRVVALSVVTNECRPDNLGSTSGQAVVDAAAQAESTLKSIVMRIIQQNCVSIMNGVEQNVIA